MPDTQQRLKQAGRIIGEPAFRQNKGLGNEVGYYIFDYPAADELIVREWLREMQSKCNASTDGFALLVFDLYDMIIDMLEQEGYLETCFRFEEKHGMDRIVKAVGRMLGLSDDAGVIVEHIRSRAPANAVVFLTGVGKCYPVLRAHKVLNNLHQALDTIPVVMFYPGKYNGQALSLFGCMKDDNYYRAFRLVE